MMTGNWTCLGTFGAGCAVYRSLLPVTSKTRQPFVCVTMTSGKVTMGTGKWTWHRQGHAVLSESATITHGQEWQKHRCM